MPKIDSAGIRALTTAEIALAASVFGAALDTAGKPFGRYGIEQQACIVEDAFRARAKGDAATLARLAPILPFPAGTSRASGKPAPALNG